MGRIFANADRSLICCYYKVKKTIANKINLEKNNNQNEMWVKISTKNTRKKVK
jgi:hypothetical protein